MAKSKARPAASRPANSTSPRTKAPKRGTLGWLAQQTSIDGIEAATRELGLLTYGTGDLDAFAVVQPGGGRDALRSDLQPGDRSIRYLDFSAPPLWGPGFSVLDVEVDAETKHQLMFHAGEEILIPQIGEIKYTFAQSISGRVQTLPENVGEGYGIRINPQIPHHAMAVGRKTPARVWMLMRYANDSAYKVVSTGKGSYAQAKQFADPRRVAEEQLKSPAVYACVAWGLSEIIRVSRQRADLTIEQLATICGVDPALLSRLESVQYTPETSGINLTLDALLRVCAYLTIPLPRLIWQSRQKPFERCLLSDAASAPISGKPILGDGNIDHQLHLSIIETQELNKPLPVPKQTEFQVGSLASWIVKKGALTISLAVDDPLRSNASSERVVTVSDGSVVHFRFAAPVKILSHTPAEIIQVVASTDCRCRSTR